MWKKNKPRKVTCDIHKISNGFFFTKRLYMRSGDRYTLKSGHNTTKSYRANIHKQFTDFSVVHRKEKEKKKLLNKTDM